MSQPRALTQRPALDPLEDAIGLLRQCPASGFALYYLGALPFVLSFLYFWAEMSRGAFAREHLDAGSLLVALSFLWCKWWQAVFSARLIAIARHQLLPPWTLRRLFLVAWPQIVLQPSGLFLLPIAALVMLPLGWVWAFYQNLSVLALDENGEPLAGPALRREAVAQANRWPGQNHVALAVLAFFSLVVWLNVAIVILAAPWLLKTFFGIESVFTLSLWSMFNTTLLAISVGVTWLCIDPIYKAFYALRCFRGRAVATGEDLRVGVRAAAAGPLRRLAAILALVLTFTASAGSAAETAPPPPAEVDRAIERVLDRPEFAWRMPREAAPPEQKGWLGSFIEGAFRLMAKVVKQIVHWIRDFFDWLGRRFRSRSPESHFSGPSGAGLYDLFRLLAWICVAVAAVALALMGWRAWQRRRRPLELAATPRPVVHDLAAEDLSADQLPEDEWLRLAREMAERGDFRLALRALYLAALASLGEQQVISIARHKSNFDYQREFRRRRPAQTELLALFTETVRTFERAWYGLHEVTRDMLDHASLDLERLRHADPSR